MRNLAANFLTPALTILLSSISLQSFGQTPTPQPQEVTGLEIGKPIEREVKAREKQSFTIELDAGQIATVGIKQVSTFVRVSLLAPDGHSSRIVDIPERKPEIKFDTIADSSGKYRYDVFGSMTVPAGVYEITFQKIRTATSDELDIQKARKLKDRFFALQYAGKFGEARPLLVNAIEIYERILGREAEGVGVMLSSLATNYHLTGDFTAAVEAYLRAIHIIEKAKGIDHPDVAAELQRLGQVYVSKGDIGKAEEVFSRALRIYEKAKLFETVETASLVEDMADLYYRIDDYKNAEIMYERAGAIWAKVVGPEHYHTVLSLTSLGYIAHETGDLPKAEKLLRRALELTEKNFPTTPYRTASASNELASVYVTMRDFAKAEELYLRSLSYLEKTDSGYLEDAFFGMARLYWAQGRTSDAIAFARRAIQAEDRVLDVNLLNGTESEKLALLDQSARNTFSLISLQADLGVNDKDAIDLAVSTIIRRKGRVNDAMADSLSALYERLGPDKKPLIEEYKDTASQLAKLILEGPEEDTPADYQSKVKALETQRAALETEIGKLTAGYFEGSPAISLAAVRNRIPADAALVEFISYRPYDPKLPGNSRSYGDERYAVYVVRATGEVGWAELGSAKDIDAPVDALRRSLRDPKRKDVAGLSRIVDEKVMAKVRKLAGNAPHLLIAPDGKLNLIPFEALVDERGKYLIEGYAVTYLTSGRDLVRMNVNRESNDKPLIVADPVFGEPTLPAEGPPSQRKRSATKRRPAATVVSSINDAYFSPLGATTSEANSIRSLFPDARILSGQNASEASLKHVNAPRMLHIATHGFFLPDRADKRRSGSLLQQFSSPDADNPMARSGLAFAGANIRSKTGDDGILTALEASGLNLWGTKLVVLSACDTGVGEVRNGEGVYGLRRAFVIAGAESLVMSMWPVSDNVTRELMTGYYKNLKQGIGRGESLRRVQLEMLKRPDRKHPFYWASFIQAGEWANLDGKR